MKWTEEDRQQLAELKENGMIVALISKEARTESSVSAKLYGPKPSKDALPIIPGRNT